MELVQHGRLQCEELSDCKFVTTVTGQKVGEVRTRKDERIG